MGWPFRAGDRDGAPLAERAGRGRVPFLMADRPNQPEGQPEPEVWIECACGRAQPLPERADVEPQCDACGASLAAAVSIAMDARAAGVVDRLARPRVAADAEVQCACGASQPLAALAGAARPTCGASLADVVRFLLRKARAAALDRLARPQPAFARANGAPGRIR